MAWLPRQIYLTINTSGEYSDYFENVIGAFTTFGAAKQAALLFAKQNLISEDASLYGEQSIIVRSYGINCYDPQHSKAETLIAGKEYEENEIVICKFEPKSPFDDE